jgi:hypothetical protein
MTCHRNNVQRRDVWSIARIAIDQEPRHVMVNYLPPPHVAFDLW